MNIINQIISSLMNGFYHLAGDYGLAIIGVTLSIRFLLLPFSLKQQKSLQKQQLVSAEVEKIKAKYKNNPKKAQEETARYLQTNGTGFAGCLLILLQLPILYSLNTVIRSHMTGTVTSVILPWITSLSVRDPYFILPAITIVIQLLPQLAAYLPCFQKLNLPKSKGRAMIYLVLINGIFVTSVPSGLALYWTISGLYTLIEQMVYHLIALRRSKHVQAV